MISPLMPTVKLPACAKRASACENDSDKRSIRSAMRSNV